MKKIILLIAAMMIAAQIQAEILWTVKSPDSGKVSYLFGTHHLAPLSVINSLPIDQLIADVDEVYGELSLQDMRGAATNMKLMEMMTAPADSTLDKVFTPAQLHEIDSVFQVMSGSPMGITTMMNRFKPMMLSTTLMALTMQKAYPDISMLQQLDQTLLAKGETGGKPVKGLESIDLQMNVIYGVPISEQAADLLKTIRQEDGGIAEMRKLTEAYLAGDLNKMYEMTTDAENGMTSAEKERLLDKRNEAWVDFLLGMLPTMSVFVIVGAGHLPGPKGLIQQLRNAGYRVEPFTAP